MQDKHTSTTTELLEIIEASQRWQQRPKANPEVAIKMAEDNRELQRMLLEIREAQNEGRAQV